MPTRTINLTDHFEQLVENLVSSGQYSDATEVIRAGLRLLERQALEDEQKLAALRGLASEAFDALDRGEGTTLDDEHALKHHIATIGLRALRGAGS